jgi:hypothetical protein
MRRPSPLTALALMLVGALAACSSDDSPGKSLSLSLSSKADISIGDLRFEDGAVVITPKSGPEGRVRADGHFFAGTAEVPLEDAQRPLLFAYYTAARSFVEHAKATGVAGAAVGATAASEVVTGLASGDTSKIGDNIEQSAGEVMKQAARLCRTATKLRAAQDALALALDAFKPYAVVKENDIHCNVS